MDKCWFVFRQTHYPAPEYKHPSMAAGAAEGPIQLGHFIPNPKAIDNIINSDGITPFTRDMRIWPTTAVDFRLTNRSSRGVEASAQGGLSDAAAAGMTVNAEAGVIFKHMMGDTWAIDRLETQIVQPTLSYLEKCRNSPQVASWVEKHKLLGTWKLYMISGLMIARGAKLERTEKNENEQRAGAEASLPGVANVGAKASQANEKEVETSGEYINDFVWAIRLTEVSKTLFKADVSQKTLKEGAVFAPGSDKVDVSLVLAEEGLSMDDTDAVEVVKKNGDKEEQQFLVALE